MIRTCCMDTEVQTYKSNSSMVIADDKPLHFAPDGLYGIFYIEQMKVWVKTWLFFCRQLNKNYENEWSAGRCVQSCKHSRLSVSHRDEWSLIHFTNGKKSWLFLNEMYCTYTSGRTRVYTQIHKTHINTRSYQINF